jgi:hypothetical protein
MWLLGAIGAALIGLSMGSDAWSRGDAEQHESWSWNGTLASGRTLEINGVNGDIVAEPGSGDRVVVTADKYSRRSDPSLVKIEVKQDSDGITICAVYPGESSPCRHLGFSFSDRAKDVNVDFHVTVPSGVAFTANNVNGGVHVHGLSARVKARTVNGECVIETAGSGQASTVNGAVRAAIGRLSPDDELAFHTVNGSITIQLPADANAELSGSTVNGGISSDFPITIHSGWGPRSASGTIGHGGARVSAHTVNGAIRYERQHAM